MSAQQRDTILSGTCTVWFIKNYAEVSVIALPVLYLSYRSCIHVYLEHMTSFSETRSVARLRNTEIRQSLVNGLSGQHCVTCPLYQEFNQLLQELL